MIWLSYTIVVCWNNNNNNEELQGCMGQMSILVYPLHWGKHPRGEGVNPPFAVLCCTSCLCQPNTHTRSPVPVFLSQIPLLPLKAWGHALQRGECVTHKGIWVIQGLLPLGSTLDMSTLDSTAWSTQVSEYSREYLST